MDHNSSKMQVTDCIDMISMVGDVAESEAKLDNFACYIVWSIKQ